MTIAQHAQLQNIIQYFETLRPEEIERAFLSHWKPFVLSLSTEEDRALAFKLFYDWQKDKMDTFLNFLQEHPSQTAVA